MNTAARAAPLDQRPCRSVRYEPCEKDSPGCGIRSVCEVGGLTDNITVSVRRP